MTSKNRLIVAAAGSGKTTHLVQQALKIDKDGVLITTYTESNEAEIRLKFFEINGHIPSNVVVMTWFKFLITHGVKPFQGGLFNFPLRGMFLAPGRSGLKTQTKNGPIYFGEDEFERYYFNNHHQAYSDKLAKLALRCDERSNGNVIDRISRVFQNIFIDEVQDLAGYDLDILIALFKSSARVLLVGDPRQVTYLTHHDAKYKNYANGGIIAFLNERLPKEVTVEIDTSTLNTSHRNSSEICSLSSKLYPKLAPSVACRCSTCRNKEISGAGLFIVKRSDYARYLETYGPMQLRDKVNSAGVNAEFPAMNFGQSKGCGFDRVAILPTQDMLKWIQNNEHDLAAKTRAKLYVALTRARYSVAFVADWHDDGAPEGFSIFA